MSTPTDSTFRPRVLFSMRNYWYIKTYDTVAAALAARGAQVHLAADAQRETATTASWNRAARAFAEATPGVTCGFAPAASQPYWRDVAMTLRFGLDYLRFLHPRYASTARLGMKAKRRAPGLIKALVRLPGLSDERGREALARVLRALEDAIPLDEAIVRYVRMLRPDLLLITPLITLGSEQTELLRTGRRLGIRTVLCVGSWDHLTSKALVRTQPDLVCVWNDVQKQEAVDWHKVPSDRVAVTGAQCFDQWFDRQPSMPRDAFCARVGLDPSRPFVAYTCTALLEGSPSEAPFVLEWVRALRAHPDLAGVGILIRPHPKRGHEWQSVDFAGLDNVVLWPRQGVPPIEADARNEYFDSLYHSAAVVGLNTTALIEAGIAGRPVLTVLDPRFRDSQLGTLHFHYLLEVGGGLLNVSESLGDHAAQVAAALGGVRRDNAPFVEAFVRPRGLATPATEVFVGALARTFERPPLGPEPLPRHLWALRLVLFPMVFASMWRRRGPRTAWKELRRAYRVWHREHRERRLAALRTARLEARRKEELRIKTQRQAERLARKHDELEAQRRREEARRRRMARRGQVSLKKRLQRMYFKFRTGQASWSTASEESSRDS